MKCVITTAKAITLTFTFLPVCEFNLLKVCVHLSHHLMDLLGILKADIFQEIVSSLIERSVHLN